MKFHYLIISSTCSQNIKKLEESFREKTTPVDEVTKIKEDLEQRILALYVLRQVGKRVSELDLPDPFEPKGKPSWLSKKTA